MNKNRITQSRKTRIGLALGLSLWMSLISGCNRKSFSPHPPVEKIGVQTLQVSSDALQNLKLTRAAVLDFPEQLNLMGKISVTEDRTQIVPSRVAGRIQSIAFASGEFVKEGQLLATLYSPDFVAAKEEYLQTLKPKSSSIAGADPDDLKNLSQMARKKLLVMGVSPEDIHEIETQIHDSGSEEALLKIRAPKSGSIIAKAAVLGNLVNVGDTLFTIGDLSRVWFLGDLYPEDLPKVHKNQTVTINVPGVNHPLMGSLSFISPLVDPVTRSIKIRALINNPEGVLKGDMYIQGSLTLNKNSALLVPTMSIVRTPEGYSVFKKISANHMPQEQSLQGMQFKKVEVKLGSERQGMTAILEGLQEGDEVVSDGALLLEAALNASENT